MDPINLGSILIMKLNYKTFGQGDPIIILHGLFGSLDNWQSFAKSLAKDFMVYILDQRDHGKSPHTKEFDYILLAEDLHRFMEKNWIFSAHIVGHSMGGKTAMQFAALYPEMLEKLIVLDITPKKYKAHHDTLFQALLSLNLTTLTSRKEAEKSLEVKIKDHSVRTFLLKNLKRNKDGSFKWKLNLPLLYKNYDKISMEIDYLETVDVPTLFVKGSNSNYILEEDKEPLRSIFSNASFKTIEGAGHWLHADKPQELKNILVDFIT